MRSGWISAILVLAALVTEAKDAEPRYRLVIAFNNVEHVPTPEALAGPCLTDRPIYGCTRFGGRRLDCDCAKNGEAWQMTARAQFITFIYLAQKALLHHEQLHIDDVRRDAVRYLDRLTSMKFADADQCQTVARIASESFAGQMEKFQRQSNATRHPLDKPASSLAMRSKR
jgi:hypothetical protein